VVGCLDVFVVACRASWRVVGRLDVVGRLVTVTVTVTVTDS